MAAGSIIIDLLMKTGAFETDTKRAEARLKALKKEAFEAGKVIGAAFAVVGAATVALVKSQIDAADASGKNAAAAGVAVEAYSALAYAAELAGVGANELSVALNTVNKAISSNDKSLKELGIQVRDAAGEFKTADVILSEVADRFQQMPEGPRKAALALDLFGRSGTKLLPLLNSGSAGIRQLTDEARALGVVIDTDTAKAAEEFNDNLTRMSAALQGVGNRVASDVLPTLVEVSDLLVDLAKNEALVSTVSETMKATFGGLVNLFQVLGVVGSDVGFVFLSVGREIGAWAAQLSALARGDLAGFRAISDAVKADGERARAELDKFQARVMAIGEPLAMRKEFRPSDNYGPANRPASPPKTPAAKERQSEAQRYLETLQKQSDALEELSSREQALREISSGRLAGLTPALERAIVKQAELNDASKQAKAIRDAQVESTSRAARASLDSLEALQASNAALRDEISLIGLDELGIIGVERARVSSLRALKEETRAKQEAAGVSEQQLQVLDAEIAALREREELLGKRISRGIEERSKESVERTGADVRDALGDSIEAGILDGFRRGEDLADIFLRELKAQFARTILRPIIQPIADAGNSVIADILRGIGAAIGGSGSGAAGPDSQTGEQIRARRAHGGRIYAGGDVLVGEKGPERIRPVTSGSVLPNDRLTDGGGGRPQVIVNTPPGVQVERQETSSDGRKLELWLANRVADGSSPLVSALRGRGVNTSGNLPRRQR